MIVKRRDILVYFFVVLLLFLTSFWGSFFNLTNIWRYAALVFSCFIGFLWYVNVLKLKTKTKEYIPWFSKYLFVFTTAMICLYIYSIKKYNESIVDVVIAGLGFLYILLIPLILYILDIKGVEKFCKYLNTLLVGTLIVYYFLELLYWGLGINVLGLQIRFGNIRLGAPYFGGIMLIYNLWKFSNIKRIQNLLIAFFYFLYIISFCGTRMEIIASTLGITYFMINRKNQSGKSIVIFWMLAIFLLVLVLNGYLNPLLRSFLKGSEEYLSTTVRFEALQYFSQIYKDNIIFGMGFVRGGVNGAWDTILYGAFHKYVFSDVGLLGFYYKLGLFSLAIYGMPIIRIIKIYFRLSIIYSNKYSSLVGGIFVYFIVCQVSLACSDVQRAMVLPLIWGLFEYLNKISDTKRISNEAAKC